MKATPDDAPSPLETVPNSTHRKWLIIAGFGFPHLVVSILIFLVHWEVPESMMVLMGLPLLMIVNTAFLVPSMGLAISLVVINSFLFGWGIWFCWEHSRKEKSRREKITKETLQNRLRIHESFLQIIIKDRF